MHKKLIGRNNAARITSDIVINKLNSGTFVIKIHLGITYSAKSLLRPVFITPKLGLLIHLNRGRKSQCLVII
jgi:hypothetical protein